MARSTRKIGTPMVWDDVRQPDTLMVADLSQFMPGAAPVRCQPWDIGTGVTGYVWPAPQPRAALLLQHGYAEYAQRFVGQYSQLVPHLLQLGISVYAFDMWGHGHSPGPRALTSVEDAVADHLAARRLLRAQQLPVFLFGHSLGGLVTASSVACDPAGVAGLILCSPALLYEKEDTLFNRLLLKGLAALAPAADLHKLVGSEPAAVADLFRGAEKSPVAQDALMYRGPMQMLLAATSLALAHQGWPRYARISAPTLALHGTADRYTDPAGSQCLLNCLSSADKTLYLVPDGYHELLNDTDQATTLHVLLQWLGQRLPQPLAAGG